MEVVIQKTLNRITIKDKHLIFGYIRNIEHNNSERPTIHIPEPIIFMVAAFYCLFDEWNKQFSCGNLQFIGSKIIKKMNSDGTSACVFGDEVNNKICKILKIEFRWLSSNPTIISIGYIKSNLFKTFCWDGGFDSQLGIPPNKQNSLNLSINAIVSSIYLYDEHNLRELDYTKGHNYTSMFKQNDLFMLVFDFINEELSLFHNGREANTLCFKDKAIFPAANMHWQGETIEVTKYELT
eukprot:123059_1